MICNKCNSEIPDSAKFCPVCGASCAAAPAANPSGNGKKFCPKCGLELESGAKFCQICGAPVNVSGETAAPVQDNSGSGMAAVSLSKESDSLVSAMNSAAAPAASIPTPANSIPTPTDSSVTPSGFSTGYSGTAPAAPSAPAYAPSAPAAAQMQNPFGDFGEGAAAVAVKPLKKKGPKVGIIIAVILGVILLAAGAFFFIDRSAFLSLFMGKPGYAAMVEGNSIKSVTDKIDTKAVSEGVKTVSDIYASFATVNKSPAVGANDTADMMYTTSAISSVNVKEIIAAINSATLETYGVNSVTETLSANVQISDTAKSMLTESGMTAEQIDEMVKVINEFAVTCTAKSTASAAQADMEAKSGTTVINARVVANENGEVYLAFPFSSEKALMVKLESAETSSVNEVKSLELDEKEISALIEDLVKVYLKYYKEGVVSTESGELTAAGLTATGKLITSEIRGNNLSDMFKEFGNTIAANTYFSGKIVEFANECGASLTEQSYKEAIYDAFDTSTEEDDVLVIKTVINNNGDVLGKCYEGFSNGSETPEFNVTVLNNGTQSAVSIAGDDGAVVTVVCEKTNDTDGTVTVTVPSGDSTISFKVSYTGVKQAKFCGKDVCTGTYTLSIVPPSDFAENAEMGKEALSVIGSSTLTLSYTVEGENTINCSVSVKVGEWATVSLNSKCTAVNDDSAITMPSDVIDLTPAVNGGELDEATTKALEDYLSTLSASLQSIAGDAFPGGFTGSVGDIVNDLSPKVAAEEISALTYRIYNAAHEVLSMDSTYSNVQDNQLTEKANALFGKYNALYGEIYAKGEDMTIDEYNDFVSRADALDAEKDVLDKEYAEAEQKAVSNNNSGTSTGNDFQTDSSTLDFDNMDYETVSNYIVEYTTRFVILESQEDQIRSDSTLSSLYDDATDAFNDMCDEFEYFSNYLEDGTFSVAQLRKIRSATKSFAEAVETLEKAMKTTA